MMAIHTFIALRRSSEEGLVCGNHVLLPWETDTRMASSVGVASLDVHVVMTLEEFSRG